jgi:hypothetical protein
MAATGFRYKRYFIILKLDDAIHYQSLNADGVAISPAQAAATYGAPIWDGTGAKPPAPRIELGGLPSNSILTTTVEAATYGAGYTVDGGGVLHAYAAGTGGTLYWIGVFAGEDHVGTTTQPIMTRRFATGFEVPNGATLSPGLAYSPYACSRDASRTSEGYGFAYRNESGTYPLTGTLTAATYHSSWERFYIRPRTYSSGGTNQDVFWSATGSLEANPALTLQMDATGKIKLYNQGNLAFPGTLVGTTPPVKLNTWARIDILFLFAGLYGTAGTATLYVNGNLTNSVGVYTYGLGTQGFHISSSLGQIGGSYNGLEIDFDDWFNAAVPADLSGLDWTSGSHFKLLHPTGFGSGHSANWIGDWRSLLANPVNSELNSVDNLNELTLTTQPLSVVDLTTDYQDEQLGCVSLQLFVASKTTTVGTSQQLGIFYGPSRTFYSLALTSVTGGSWGAVSLTNAGGLLAPPSMYPVDLTYQASATTTQKLAGVLCEAEFLGTWGLEDEADISYPVVNVHNAPYPNSEWAKYIGSGTDILSPVAVYSGTYAGNSLGQDINTKLPIHWWFVRPIGSSNTGGFWFSSMAGSHNALSFTPAPHKGGVAFLQQPDGTGIVRVSGSNNAINNSGLTYQWIGFSDPAMRYVLNGAYAHISGLASAVNKLRDASFNPDGLFLMMEHVAAATTGVYFKGPGHTTNQADLLDTGVGATIVAMTQGVVTTKSAVHGALPGGAYSAWRNSDSMSTTGPVYIGTYTGDGTGARNIVLTLGGASPLFAMVSPTDSAAYFRDPSHLTTHSCTLAGVDSTTAITAGTANQISIGATLNTNLTKYEVFVLSGQTTGGWSGNPANPIFAVDTSVVNGGAFVPPDLGGWWQSLNGFTGGSSLVTVPQNPKHPRAWDKVAAFSAGSNGGVLGGSPGIATSFNNHLIYAGDDYVLGTDEPPIRIFDGQSDRLMARVPSIAGVPPQCILSMLQAAGMIYLTTLDGGADDTYTGRVFSFDPNSQVLTPVGAQFTGGEVPYALAWHMDRLWLGTNLANGEPGNVYFIRPGIDTAWTTDHALSGDTLGGVTSMCSYKGNLYVGTDNVGGLAGKVLVRTTVDGAYAGSKTGPNTGSYNGFPTLNVFNGLLIATYWDSGPNSLILTFDGTTWSTVYTGAATTLRPLTSQFVWNNNLFVVGGSKSFGAVLLESDQGAIFTDRTVFMTGGTTTETTVPAIGVVGL